MEIELLRVKEPINETKINSASVVYNLMQKESKADRECMWVLHLNNKNKIISKEIISMGTISQTVTTPREVFRRAVINGTKRIILVHNHPSGDTIPSTEDEILEKAIQEAGMILGISLLDFIILGDGYYSSKENEKTFNNFNAKDSTP